MRLGSKHSDSTKALISKSLTGENNPFFNMSHTAESLLSISNAKSTGRVYIYNAFNQLQLVVSSVRMLAGKVNANSTSLASVMLSGDLFRGGWYLTSQPFTAEVSPLISSQDSSEAVALFDAMKASSHIRKAVFVFDADTLEFIRSYDGLMQCAKDLHLSHNTISSAMPNNSLPPLFSTKIWGAVGKYIFSGHRIFAPSL